MENYRHNVSRPRNPAVRGRRSPSCPSCERGSAGFDTGRECTGLAMAKIVFQSWQKIYPCEKAIVRGTLFGELDLPFEARRSCR